MCIITTCQPGTNSYPNSNPNPNLTTNQHAIVNVQLNIVTCPAYPYETCCCTVCTTSGCNSHNAHTMILIICRIISVGLYVWSFVLHWFSHCISILYVNLINIQNTDTRLWLRYEIEPISLSLIIGWRSTPDPAVPAYSAWTPVPLTIRMAGNATKRVRER